MNPRIGNAAGSPTISQFTRNNSRPLWARKWLSTRGGSNNSYRIEIPTNQPHLQHKQEVIEHDYGGSIITIILIFVILTKKTAYRLRKMRERFSRILKKLKIKAKSKIKKKLLIKSLEIF